jgi:pantetheine-phosphate adenylyltransferase
MKYKKVAVGGSFGILHKGHVALLDKAFNSGGFVLIGLTSNEMLTKDVAPFEKRKKTLLEFLENRGQYDIIELNDPFGPAASDGTIEAIVVSAETEPGASEINELREQNGLVALDIISIPLVLADDQRPISSTRIRKGEIDKRGRILPEHE